MSDWGRFTSRDSKACIRGTLGRISLALDPGPIEKVRRRMAGLVCKFDLQVPTSSEPPWL